jgi:D-arabinose 1-dehydrogenase-like Zn-dependent alcohol dehydrogenase
MNRTANALTVMQQEPERIFTSASLSVALNCAPAQAKAALKLLTQKGELEVVGLNGFRIQPPRTPDQLKALILRHLQVQEHLEFTDAALVAALPTLNLVVSQAAYALRELHDAGQVVRTRDAWDWYACV